MISVNDPLHWTNNPHLKGVTIRSPSKPSIYDDAHNATKRRSSGKPTNWEMKLKEKLNLASTDEAKMLIQIAKHELGLDPSRVTSRDTKTEVIKLSRQLSVELLGSKNKLVSEEELEDSREDIFSDDEEEDVIGHVDATNYFSLISGNTPTEATHGNGNDDQEKEEEVVVLRNKVAFLESKMEELTTKLDMVLSQMDNTSVEEGAEEESE